MRYLSVCSGIEAATCAWHPIGWEPFAFSEIDPFPSAVLAHHYPNVQNLGDMTKFKEWPDATIDVLVGGTPCQSFSVAGLRKGLDDPRGSLMLTYLAIADKYRPTWLAWENVPGVLSSGGGRDFGSLLGGMAELGYGFAYRVLDAQFFGVAQRRRRVFVVGHLGDWRRAAAVLFERHSLQGNPAPSREAGKNIAPCLDVRAGRSGETTFHTSGGLVPQPHAQISPAIKARDSKGVSSDGDGDGAILVPMVAHSLRAAGFDASEDGTGRGTPLIAVHGTQDPCTDEHLAFALGRNSGQENAIAIPHVDTMPTLRAAASQDGPGHGARSGDSKDEYIVPTYTLAIRGRGDSHDLELRDDGTANALLTPNGGRFGIGVGAVAYGIDYERNAHSINDATGPLLKGSSSGGGHPLPAIAFAQNQRDEVRLMDVAGALAAETGAKQQTYAHVGMQVRRLTPKECERLQGFADDYTNIMVRGKPAADGPRYKALGNSMAVPCMSWIGKRIALVDSIPLNESEAA